jgi:hypothetical protein
MKLLFDQNLSPRLPRLLADIYGESIHVREVGKQAATCLEFARTAFSPPYGKTFFKRLAKRLSHVLGVSEEAVFDRVVYRSKDLDSSIPNGQAITAAWVSRSKSHA